MTNKIIDALVQNYYFKRASYAKIPSVDYVYPSLTANGNTEAFRFSGNLRRELSERSGLVKTALAGKELAWTYEPERMLEIASIAPRLGIREQINGEINSIYQSPFLFLGLSEKECTKGLVAYVVKPIIDGNMAWFELSEQELDETRSHIEGLVQRKPYQNLLQRIFGGKK